MNSEELDRVEQLVQDFWVEWKELVEKFSAIGEHHGEEVHSLLLTRMQEKASVYGAL